MHSHLAEAHAKWEGGGEQGTHCCTQPIISAPPESLTDSSSPPLLQEAWMFTWGWKARPR